MQDLLADHDVLGQALQALIRPWMQSDFLVAARKYSYDNLSSVILASACLVSVFPMMLCKCAAC